MIAKVRETALLHSRKLMVTNLPFNNRQECKRTSLELKGLNFNLGVSLNLDLVLYMEKNNLLRCAKTCRDLKHLSSEATPVTRVMALSKCRKMSLKFNKITSTSSWHLATEGP